MRILDQETALEEVAANTGHSTSGFLWDCLAWVDASSYAFSSVFVQQYLFPTKVICFRCWNTTAVQKIAVRKWAGHNLCLGSFVLFPLGFSPCHSLQTLCTFTSDSATFVLGTANLLCYLRARITKFYSLRSKRYQNCWLFASFSLKSANVF